MESRETKKEPVYIRVLHEGGFVVNTHNSRTDLNELRSLLKKSDKRILSLIPDRKAVRLLNHTLPSSLRIEMFDSDIQDNGLLYTVVYKSNLNEFDCSPDDLNPVGVYRERIDGTDTIRLSDKLFSVKVQEDPRYPATKELIIPPWLLKQLSEEFNNQDEMELVGKDFRIKYKDREVSLLPLTSDKLRVSVGISSRAAEILGINPKGERVLLEISDGQ